MMKPALVGAIALWLLSAAAAQESDDEESVEKMPATGQNQQPPTKSSLPKKVTPRRFIPSEEISADSAVSFPVDI